jgi:hypothetical protein
VVNFVATADRRVRGLVAGGAALMAVPALIHLAGSVPYLVGYFHLTYATAFLIITLVLEGSPWLFWVFPWIIPEVATLDVLIAILGVSAAAGW